MKKPYKYALGTGVVCLLLIGFLLSSRTQPCDGVSCVPEKLPYTLNKTLYEYLSYPNYVILVPDKQVYGRESNEQKNITESITLYIINSYNKTVYYLSECGNVPTSFFIKSEYDWQRINTSNDCGEKLSIGQLKPLTITPFYVNSELTSKYLGYGEHRTELTYAFSTENGTLNGSQQTTNSDSFFIWEESAIVFKTEEDALKYAEEWLKNHTTTSEGCLHCNISSPIYQSNGVWQVWFSCGCRIYFDANSTYLDFACQTIPECGDTYWTCEDKENCSENSDCAKLKTPNAEMPPKCVDGICKVCHAERYYCPTPCIALN